MRIQSTPNYITWNSSVNKPESKSWAVPKESSLPEGAEKDQEKNEPIVIKGNNTEESRTEDSPLFLDNAEKRQVEQLRRIDQKVHNHEMAHIAAGGQYVHGGAQYLYRRGPDGQSYAVAGEVSIDIAKVSNDPAATLEKMDAVRRAALAPVDPSGQDRRVAAKATQIRTEALMELASASARDGLGPNDDAESVFQRSKEDYPRSSPSQETGVRVGATVDTYG